MDRGLFAWSALDNQVSAVDVGQALGNNEPQTYTLLFVKAALKLHVRSDVRDLLRGHAPASITDREGELALRHTGTDAHRRAGLGELERIVRS